MEGKLTSKIKRFFLLFSQRNKPGNFALATKEEYIQEHFYFQPKFTR
jgi:hypothetical protein